MAKKAIKKSAKVKLTLVEKARLLLECFDGNVYGPKTQISFKIDSPDWALKLMVDFGFYGKSPDIITTCLIMEVCYDLSLYPKSSKLQALQAAVKDYTANVVPAQGDLILWLRVVPSSWDYLTVAMNDPSNANMRAEVIMLTAYRNYCSVTSSKLFEALSTISLNKEN